MRHPSVFCRTVALIVCLSGCLFCFNAARAGGLEFPDLGTAALGRGGAFVARADDPSAFYYNPAGLSLADGIDLHLSVHLVNLNVDHARAGGGGYWLETAGGEYAADCPAGAVCIADPDLDYRNGVPGEPFAPVSMHRVGVLPLFVFNWGDFAGVRGLSISAGILPPASFGMNKYPQDGAQRYVLIDTRHFILFPGVGVAYRFNRFVQLGGVFLSGFASLEQSLRIRPLPSMASTTFNEGEGGDAGLTIQAADPFVPSGIFGVLSRPLDWLDIGLSLRLPSLIRAAGTMTYQSPAQDMAHSYMKPGEDKVRLEQSFPLSLRAGVRYHQSRFDIEVDFVFENWSSVSRFDIYPDAVITDPINENTETRTAMPDTSVPKNFKDAWSVRLGSDVGLVPGVLDLRVGMFFQSSAYPDNNDTFAVDFPFAGQIGVGGGVSVHAGRYLDIDVGYLRIFQPQVVVERGIVQQQGLPLSSGENIGNTVNGGSYDVNLNVFSLALTGHFLRRGADATR